MCLERSHFYTKHLGFSLETNAAPAFASVTRGNLRLLLSGEKSSGRRPLPDGTKPVPEGWNRIELQVTDLKAEVVRLHSEGVKFRRDDIVTGPGRSQVWLVDPSGNSLNSFSLLNNCQGTTGHRQKRDTTRRRSQKKRTGKIRPSQAF
jgi:hypothetical protein